MAALGNSHIMAFQGNHFTNFRDDKPYSNLWDMPVDFHVWPINNPMRFTFEKLN